MDSGGGTRTPTHVPSTRSRMDDTTEQPTPTHPIRLQHFSRRRYTTTTQPHVHSHDHSHTTHSCPHHDHYHTTKFPHYRTTLAPTNTTQPLRLPTTTTTTAPHQPTTATFTTPHPKRHIYAPPTNYHSTTTLNNAHVHDHCHDTTTVATTTRPANQRHHDYTTTPTSSRPHAITTTRPRLKAKSMKAVHACRLGARRRPKATARKPFTLVG